MSSSIRNILVFAGWYPNEYNLFEGVFVRDQMQYLADYGNLYNYGISPKISVIKLMPPVDLPNFLFRRKRKIKNEEIEKEKMKIFYGQDFLLSARFQEHSRRKKLKLVGSLYKKAVAYFGASPDVILAVTLPALEVAHLLHKQLCLDIPVILHEHSVPLEMHMRTELEKQQRILALNSADAIIVTADRQIPEVKKYLGLEIPLYKIWNHINRGFLNAVPKLENKNNDALELISVGFLNEQKAIHRLIKAVSLIPKDILHLVHIIGDGPEKVRLQKMSVNLGIQDRVKFWGFQSHEEIAEQMKVCDGLVLCSKRENCPNVLIEAQYMGLPCIVTRNDASERIILPGNGISVEQDEGEALAKGITDFFEQKSSFQPSEIRKKAIQAFSPETFSKDFFDVFKQQLSSKP